MLQSVEILNDFNKIFWNIFSGKRKPFPKTGLPLLVEIAKIDNAPFPYKTAIPEANVKTNKTVSTK